MWKTPEEKKVMEQITIDKAAHEMLLHLVAHKHARKMLFLGTCYGALCVIAGLLLGRWLTLSNLIFIN